MKLLNYVQGSGKLDNNYMVILTHFIVFQVILLDFGATREFRKKFVDDYIRIIKAARDQDREGILKWSQKAGFLTGYETKVQTMHYPK